MKEVFEVYADDNGLTQNFKKEANILLASLEAKNDVHYTETFDNICNALPLIKSLGNMDIQDESEVNDVLFIVNNFWNKGILAPLTLKDNEFRDKKCITKNVFVNIRCSFIERENNITYNRNAYSLIVRKAYNDNHKEQIILSQNYEVTKNPRIYITKGGVLTGEYIENCIIPDKEVKKGHYTLQSIVKINASCIIMGVNTNDIYTVDSRDTKLKVLSEFYFVPRLFDEEIAKQHLDIRKYKKL